MILAYLRHAKQQYRKNSKQTSEVALIKSMCKPLREMYANLPAREFGTLKLETLREFLLVVIGGRLAFVGDYQL